MTNSGAIGRPDSRARELEVPGRRLDHQEQSANKTREDTKYNEASNTGTRDCFFIQQHSNGGIARVTRHGLNCYGYWLVALKTAVCTL